MLVKYGQVIDGFQTEALIVRNEKIYKAPTSGNITFFEKEGERVKSGQAVAKVSNYNKTRTVYSREAGIISYSYDNLENQLNTNSVKELSIKKFNNIKNSFNKRIENKYIKENKSLFRLINNTYMYAVIKTTSEEAERYWINETVFISNNNDDNRLLEATIMDVLNYDNESLLILKLKKFVNDWLNIRKVKVQFVKNIYRGILIPSSSILPTSDGYKVAIVKSNNNYELEKIKIVFKGENHLIIDGLDVGDKILIDPAKENFNTGGSL